MPAVFVAAPGLEWSFSPSALLSPGNQGHVYTSLVTEEDPRVLCIFPIALGNLLARRPFEFV